tara:strand:+ start:1780 stop:2913 length:1134 start_codon:yes stop_codon:yes gene_type:complete
MEELIQKQFGVSVQEFRDTYVTVVPAYYSSIINALDAENVETLQAIIDEINMVQDTSGVPQEEQFETQNSIEQQIQGEISSALEAAGLSVGASRQVYVKNPDTGKLELQMLPSNFGNGFTALFNITQQPELLAELQDSFIKNGIVEENYFDDEEVFGEKTQAVLSLVMEYADNTIFIQQDSEEGQALIEQHGSTYGFLEGDPDNVAFSMAVLDLAIEGVSQSVKSQKEMQEKLADEQAVQVLASQYDVPSDLEMEETIDELFGSIVPRNATAAEKARYSTRLAELYSPRFKELEALEKAIRTNNIFETVNVTKPFEGRDITYQEEQLKTDIFQITDPEAVIQSEIQEDLSAEASAIEQGNAARRQQSSLIAAMLGQI